MPESENPKTGISDSRSSGSGMALAQPVSADQVAGYLRHHPDFLGDYPELLDVLTPPKRDRGEGVVDLQQFMVERLRREIADLTLLRDDMVAGAEVSAGGRPMAELVAERDRAVIAVRRAVAAARGTAR